MNPLQLFALVLPLVLFLTTGVKTDLLRPPGLRTRNATVFARSGDVSIGYLADIHAPDSTGLQCTDAVLFYACATETLANFALDQINKRLDLLPNLTLGLVVVDACDAQAPTLDVATYFMKDDGNNCAYTNQSSSVTVGYEMYAATATLGMQESPSSVLRPYDVVGVIGPSGSDAAIAVSSMLGIYQLPVVGLFSTSDDLSDKTRYTYFARLVAPDSVMIQGLLDISEHYGWSYISVLYSDGAYGENGAAQIINLIRAKPYNICVAVSLEVPSDANEDDYSYIVTTLISFERARAVISFMEFPDMQVIFHMVDQAVGHGKFLFLAGDSFAGYLLEDFPTVLEGSIHLDHPYAPVPDYQDFFYSAAMWDIRDVFFVDMWQNAYNCVMPDVGASVVKGDCVFSTQKANELCTFGGGWTLKDRVYDSVYVMAHALHNLISAICPNAFFDKSLLQYCIRGDILFDFMLNISFEGVMGKIEFTPDGNVIESLVVRQFQKQPNGSFIDAPIGTWNSTWGLKLEEMAVDWNVFLQHEANISTPVESISSLTPFQSVCSYACGTSEYVISQSSRCCWVCASCRSNEFITANRSQCESCPQFQWPDPNDALVCLPIEPTYLHLSNAISIAMLFSAVTGILFSLSVILMYKLHSNHKLVKATSKQLCLIILAGTFLVSSVVIVFVVKPDSDVICAARHLGFHFGINLIYAPLLVKNVRIYRIFDNAQNGGVRPRYTSNSWQMVFASIISALMLVLVALLEILSPSISTLRMPSPFEEYVEIYCLNSLVAFLVPLSYNICIILVCTVTGFITRKLPDNFNESWFIFISAATTLFAWAVFVPAYFTMYYAYLQSVILGFCLVLNCFITLGCLFSPILYAVIFVPNGNIKFTASMLTVTNDQSSVHPETSSHRF